MSEESVAIDWLRAKTISYESRSEELHYALVLYNLIMNLQKENQELKKQLDCALGLLSENCPPCEKNGFMDRYSDYCERNCGVDEEIFKKCWLMYIKDKTKEVE